MSMLLMLIPAVPILLALAALSGQIGRRGATGGVMLTSVLALLVVLLDPAPLALPWLLLGTHLALDELSRVLLFCAALLWPAATLAAGELFAGRDGRRFGMSWLFTMAGNLGMLLSQDLASFYLCFAVMTFSAYGLVVHKVGDEAFRAGRIYLILSIFGESLLLAGIFLLAAEGGNPTVTDIPAVFAGMDQPQLAGSLLMAGFAVKMGVIPLHVWLPLAHPAAPVPASAVLSGLLVKGGLVGWLRFLPDQETALQTAADLLLILGLTGAFAAALVGSLQQRPKTVLAYSTVSQMGLLTVPVALVLGGRAETQTMLPLIALFAGHHALAKGALFLSVEHWHGGRWRQLLTVIAALSIAGLPLTGGLVAKAALKSATAAPLPLLITLSSITTSLLLLRFMQQLSASPGPGNRPPALVTAAWGLVLAAALLLPWVLADSSVLGYALSGSGLRDAVWPLLLALGVAIMLRRRRLPTIPEGDLVAPIEYALRRIKGWLQTSIGAIDPQDLQQRLIASVRPQRRFRVALARWSMTGEQQSLAAVAIIAMVLLLLLLLT